ncbi:hypothetical protein NH340_JMT07629 [Sarcoptes scabiei]|nr:hypothetical protein NH340_JMT07629 [Sarcoptes scabiei]
MCSSSAGDRSQSTTYQTPEGLRNLFGQVDEVKDTMSKNMKEIMERGDKLQQLENTSEQMFVDAKNLSGQAATVPKNMKKK